MAKLVKYCSKCEEGFAERFGFCPNCGGQLEVFEMSPVVKSEEVEKARKQESETISPVLPATASVIPVAASSYTDSDDILELDAVDMRDEVPEKEPEVFTAPTVESNGFHEQTFAAKKINYSSKKVAESENFDDYDGNDYDGNYHVTVVSGKPNNWFAPFLLGLMCLALIGSFGVWLYAVWSHQAEIPEINDEGIFFSSLTDDEPTEMEEIKREQGKKGGGGGGGGNENPDPASRGRIPNHSDVKNQLMIAPRFDSDLKIRNTIQDKVQKTDDGQQIGIGDADGTSGGSGKGKGLGKGFGDGFGDGQGDGRGRGKGKGTGNGNGDGIGDDYGSLSGDDDGDKTPQVKQKPVGENKAFAVTFKPKPTYTDAARQNNVQGTVSLRVTFNANGTIGSVTPVNSLPYGLTEQAISAAKRITFQPQLKNGQPVAVTKVVQFTFTIY